jgi:hypothetical protein
VGTVMSRLARGREQLRRLLEGQRPQLQAVPGTPGKEADHAG